ncbi:MAG: acyl carrier protein, partial [Burkholderiales bacterium PBB5]
MQSIQQDILALLDSVLGLDGRGLAFGRDTPLLGA